MPKSKNKRKNGRPCGPWARAEKRLALVRRRCLGGAKVTYEDVKADARAILKLSDRYERGTENLNYLLLAQDDDALLAGSIRIMYAIERLKTTMDQKDFSLVASQLMLGYMALRSLDIEEEAEAVDAVRTAAYMLVQCRRLRCRGQAIPDANLEPVRDGVEYAQKALKLLQEENPRAYMDNLKRNSPRAAKEDPADEELRSNALLGRYAKLVEEQYADDERAGLLNLIPVKEETR